MFAQAMVEKGLLDSASMSLSNLFTNVDGIVRDKPYLIIVVTVVIVFLLIRKR